MKEWKDKKLPAIAKLYAERDQLRARLSALEEFVKDVNISKEVTPEDEDGVTIEGYDPTMIDRAFKKLDSALSKLNL